MEISLLSQIGLTKREIEIYLKLLKQGESSASEIAKDSSISRTHVYEALESLIKRGLASTVIKNFKKYYLASEPKKIEDYLEDKKREIDNQKQKIKYLIPQLNAIKKSKKEGAKINVYEGQEGFKTFIIDTIKEKESEILMLNVTKAFKERFSFFAEHYFKEKIKRKVKSKVIFAEKFEFLDPLAQKKFLIKEDISPTTTLIYRNKVAIILWLEKITVVVIESKEATKEYKDYFNILWKQAEK